MNKKKRLAGLENSSYKNFGKKVIGLYFAVEIELFIYFCWELRDSLLRWIKRGSEETCGVRFKMFCNRYRKDLRICRFFRCSLMTDRRMVTSFSKSSILSVDSMWVRLRSTGVEEAGV